MRVLRCLMLLALLGGTVAPARAEIAWVDVGGSFELSGAQLLRLRSELPTELQDSLKAVRNIEYKDEAAFRAAVGAALLTDDFRSQWLDRLTEASAQPGGAFGLEPRTGDVLTITIGDSSHTLDANAFTSQTWLESLPAPATDSPFATDLANGCLTVGLGNAHLIDLCSPTVTDEGTTVILKTTARSVRGLGQEFVRPGNISADWIGGVRHGFNVMAGFNGGANGNTLFPIAYFDAEPTPFALILDNRYQQEWDFSHGDYRLRVWGGTLQLHVLSGETLADIRRHFMALAGRPPIPPKAAFGLWLSEYGFEDWQELDDKVASLRAHGFPLSGVVLDLFWFGGISPNSPDSRMGSLRWDEENFPDPAGKIAALRADGIETMLIEESYVSSGLAEYAALADRHGLAHDEVGAPLLVNPAGNWWGKGGMIDWTVPAVRDFWHDFRRKPLIDMGVAGHWTDLGEPEMINPGFRYSDGLTEAQVLNSYNLLWLQSIADGYARTSPHRRPFMMSRSGGMGMQRLGAAMWSGDTGSDFGSLAAQMPNQQNMMWSGIDYYGSDVGGFHREALGSYPGKRTDAMDALYTQWLAYSAMFEVPVRPHTENLCNCKETAPDRIGDVASNLANLKLRYDLMPYYYSLAYAAYRKGEPVIPSVDYWFPDATDGATRGDEKMVGSELLSAGVAKFGQTDVAVFLPAGDWYDFRTGQRRTSVGETITLPLMDGPTFRLPLFARDGAIVPTADGVVHVFGSAPHLFDWYDDDGSSTDYRYGRYELIRFSVNGKTMEMHRAAGLKLKPERLVWTVANSDRVTAVSINGSEVAFSQDGGTVTVPLPDFSDRLVVTLR